MDRLLDGKVAVITGSGRGIGRAAAELFSAHGARVVIADVDRAPLLEASAAIRSCGGEVLSVEGDVTDAEFPDHLIQTTLATYGGLDILVNNAGYTWDGTIHKMADEQWQAMLAVHLTAPFRIIRAAAPFLRDRAKTERETEGCARARKIINISSTSGTRGNAGQANYAAAKAGIVGLTKTIAREWGQFNIQANAVAFGWIDTRLTHEKETNDRITRGDVEIQLGIPAEQLARLAKLTPLGRTGTAVEAAGVVLFFASPLSDFVSGQLLEVTGGW